jgi:chromosome segregation ATPase
MFGEMIRACEISREISHYHPIISNEMSSSCSECCSCDLDAHIRVLLKSDVKDIDKVLKRILQQRTEENAGDVVLCPKADVFRAAIRAQEEFLDELKGREQENAAAIEKARLRIEVCTRVMNHLGTQMIDEKGRAKEKLDQLRDIQADRRKIADTVGKGKDELVALRRGDEEIRLEMNHLRHKTKIVGKQRSAALGKIRALEDELAGYREGALAAEAELVEIKERARVAASDIDVARVGLGDATARLVGARAELVDANVELERTLVSVEETRYKIVHARTDGSSLKDELAKLANTKSELSGVRSELADTKSELSGVRAELADTMSELSGVRSELADTKSELSGVRAELADTMSELAYTTSELADTKSEISGVMSEIDIVYSELKSVWDSKSELETTYSELKNEHGISKSELERARSELAHMNSMRAKIAVSPDQLKVVLKDVVNCDKRLTRANVLLASLYKELSDTESDIASTRSQIQARRTVVLNNVISSMG